MQIKEIHTTLENIIDAFNANPEGLTTKELYTYMQEHFGYDRSLRSLELTYLPKLENGVIDDVIFIRNHRGKHQLIDERIYNKEAIQKYRDKMTSQKALLYEEKVYMRLALEAIKELSDISDKHHHMIEKRLNLNELESPYFIENAKIEHIDSTSENFLKLKHAIEMDNLIEFTFHGKEKEQKYIVEPYKLIIFDGLWYLYGKDTQEKETSSYKTWRYRHISDVTIELRESFRHQVPDEVIEYYLSKIHSPHSTLDKEIKVRIRIDPKIVKSFNPRVHLPGYIEDPENDPLIFSAIVTNFKDIEPEIKSWLPHIEILEPQEFKEILRKDLEAYIQKLL